MLNPFGKPRGTYTTDAVYGISRDVPLNYVPRKSVDDEFISNLTRDKHVVIYGSSKQGKTCLRKHCLKEEDSILVQCQNRWAISDLHNNILKRAGFETETSSKRTASGKNKISASIGTNAIVSAKVSGETGKEASVETTFQQIELDPEDPNDVLESLARIGFNKFIVLEDFHYLPQDTQRDFAVALKAFHERSKLSFIIVGVWLEENRLVVYNGDLTGRMVAVNADKWTASELQQVISEGEKLLNVQFSPGTRSAIIGSCNDSVYIVQEVCRQACVEAGVNSTRPAITPIEAETKIKAIVDSIVNQQSARYRSFVTDFSSGFQATQWEMYKWILFPVLRGNTMQAEQGFRYSAIRKLIEENHPSGDTFNPGNLTQALLSVSSLQVSKGIKPIILDYDSTNRKLNIVDRGFILWLQNQKKEELLKEVGLPVDVGIQTPLDLAGEHQ